MARKKHNPGCPCCEADFPCTPTDCGDETTSPIRRVTLQLSLPDEIDLINPPSGGAGLRLVYASTGWSTINGTYTFELNLDTCIWQATKTPDSSGICAEAYRLGGDTDCSNYLARLEDARESGLPVFDSCYRVVDASVVMSRDVTGTIFTHNFNVNISTNGPEFFVSFKPSTGNENLCGESPLVVDEIRLDDTNPSFDCKNLGSTTGTANSYED